jgi:hypothetical protein
MVTFSIPFTGIVVELTPRWGSPPAPVSLLLWVLLAVIPLLLVLWLYRYELILVSRATARCLLALRLTVILLLLTLVLFQPSLLPAFSQKAPERILLVVDRTGSMDATDPERPPIEKLRLARALNLAGDLASDRELDDWIAQGEDRFKLTDSALSSLRNAGAPEAVLGKLQSLKDRPFEREPFLKELTKSLGKDDMTRFQQDVLDHTLYRGNNGDGFKVTDQSLAMLRKANVPFTLLVKLERLKDKPLKREAFLKELTRLLDMDELERFQHLLLNLALNDKNTEIQLVSAEEFAGNPIARGQIEARNREKFNKVCERVAGLSRTETMRRLLAEDGGSLLKKLGDRFEVNMLGFAEDVRELPANRANEMFSWPNAPGDAKKPTELTTTPERAFTDLNLPLRHALEEASQGKGSLRAVVLLTDGRQNRGEVVTDLATKLGGLKTPVYPVAFGARQSRTTLAVLDVEAPSLVLKDPDNSPTINTQVKARVRVRGIGPQPLTVELKQGGRVLGREVLQHRGEDRDYQVAFPVSLDKEEPQTMSVEIQPPEGLVEKNGLQRQTEINVVKEQAEVLMIDAEARWEYHYVAVALGRDPLVHEVKSVVFEQPRLKKIPEEELKKQNWPALKMPTEPHALAEYDCIILGDPTPDQLTLPNRKQLASYVRNGGTLVVVAGKKAMPMRYPQLPIENQETADPLAELLPIIRPRIVQSRGGFPITLTDEGRDTALLRMEDNAGTEGGQAGVAKRSLWQELPPHYWAVVGQKKPAASTLAFYPGEAEERGKELTKAEQEAQSLIAWQTYGKGRVLFVGLDSTWRWRFKVGDKYHHRFWGQLIRWAMADKLLTGGVPLVRFGTTRTTFELGQEIDIRVRMARKLEPLPAKAEPDRPYQATILRVLANGKEEKVAVVPLLVREDQPRVLDGKVRDLPAGNYRIALDLPALARQLPSSVDLAALKATLVVVAPPSEEMLDVSTDWELLENVATASKANKVYTPEKASQLVEDLKSQEERLVDRTPRPLWTWWPTLVLIVLLLTVEWVARKWAGLP